MMLTFEPHASRRGMQRPCREAHWEASRTYFDAASWIASNVTSDAPGTNHVTQHGVTKNESSLLAARFANAVSMVCSADGSMVIADVADLPQFNAQLCAAPKPSFKKG